MRAVNEVGSGADGCVAYFDVKASGLPGSFALKWIRRVGTPTQSYPEPMVCKPCSLVVDDRYGRDTNLEGEAVQAWTSSCLRPLQTDARRLYNYSIHIGRMLLAGTGVHVHTYPVLVRVLSNVNMCVCICVCSCELHLCTCICLYLDDNMQV